MVTESLAIIVVFLLATCMFIHVKKNAIVLLLLPMLSVPLFYLLSTFLNYSLIDLGNLSDELFSVCVVCASSVIGSGACGLLSLLFKSRKGKTAYLGLSLFFQVVIAIGYVINII